MTKRHFILSLFLLSILVLFNPPQASASSMTHRIAGYDRYQTAVAASQNGWPDGAESAILAYGENFPDALSAGPLSRKYNAPILLTGSSYLNSDTAIELKRLKVKKVYIIGGTAVISKEIEEQLSLMNIVSTRLAGQDRYDTALIVAQEIGVSQGVFVTTGLSFPDALSIGPIAAAKDMPILLAPPSDLTPSLKSFLSKNQIPLSFIVTGNSELSDKVIAQFPNREIISGADPYDRNINLIDRFEDTLDLSTVYVATGENFPDALATSALAQKNKNVILLHMGNTFTNSGVSFLRANIISKLHIMGGSSVISVDTESTLAKLPAQIESVANVNDTVQEQQKYEPPRTVTVTKTNGLKQEVPVAWSLTSVYSLRAGIYYFEGKVKNYSGSVFLNLTVIPVVTKLNNITAEIVQNGHFSFPATVEASMSDNTIKSFPVTWSNNIVNLNKLGTYTFSGSVESLTQKVTLTLKITEDLKVNFPDLALKTRVGQVLGKASDATIYKSDVLSISVLSANNSGITDLTGLEYFTNLQTLQLGNNTLTKITPLTKLTNLKHLELRNSGLKDLTAIKGLTALTFLDISSNNIMDFSPLKGLTRLNSLYLSNNLPLSPPLNYTPDYSSVRQYYKNLSGKDFSL